MVQNFPGPYEVEITYTENGLSHKHRVSFDCVSAPTPGDAPSAITVVTRDSVGAPLDTSVLAYVNVLKALYASTASFVSYDVWKYEPLTYTRSYITSGSLNVAGTNVLAFAAAQQITFTLRTSEGGIMRVVLLQPAVGGDVQEVYADMSGAQKAVVDHLLGTASWILAKDTSWPIVSMRLSRGQNEKIWRKLYR